MNNTHPFLGPAVLGQNYAYYGRDFTVNGIAVVFILQEYRHSTKCTVQYTEMYVFCRLHAAHYREPIW